jgi:phosphatidylinositol-3-phosphatase
LDTSSKRSDATLTGALELSMHDDHKRPMSASRCTNCFAALAHDQHYCVECGQRRGPLPQPAAELLGSMLEQGAETPRPQPVTDRAPERRPVRTPLAFGITMPTPRAAAASVLAMLAFGVIVGTFGTPAIQSLASSPLLLAVSPAQTAPSASGPANSVDAASASNGPATRTITVTTGSPAPPQPSGGSSGPSTAGGGTTGGNSSSGGGGSTSTNGMPPIHHLFLIVLSDQGFGQTFSPSSPDKYLSGTLTRQGELVENYYAVAASPLANRVALISGQGPTQQTIADCPKYAAIKPASKHSMGQVIGNGCVYPKKTLTLADELTAKHKTWKAYVEGIDKGPHGQPSSCRHPKLGAADADQAPRPKDPYVTWSNPFVYFTSLSAACSKNDVGLDQLGSDLKSASKAPTFAFIAPDPCHDGSDQPCAQKAKAGVPTADEFLRSVVPEIKSSPAYKDNGLIAITFDEAPQTGVHADPSSCCNTPKYPNLPATTTTTTTTTPTAATTPTSTTTTTTPTGTATTPATPASPPSPTTTTTSITTASTATASTTTASTTTPSTTTTSTTTTSTTTPPSTGTGVTSPTGGGGQVGLLLISSYVKPGSLDVVDYFNHYSLLGSIANIFGVKRIGYASDLQLPVFDASIFNGQ